MILRSQRRSTLYSYSFALEVFTNLDASKPQIQHGAQEFQPLEIAVWPKMFEDALGPNGNRKKKKNQKEEKK